jgi:hypothetical protein
MEHGRDGNCVIGTEERELPGDYARCQYPFCRDKGKHAALLCPTLNRRCLACFFRGHDRESGRCGQVAANLAIFETSAHHGYVTSNRIRDFGAANGYYPIIRLAQLHQVSALGGYARMLTLHPNKVKHFIDKADAQHDRWVGAEPFNTQIIVEEAFAKMKSIQGYGEAVKQYYKQRNEYLPRARKPPQRVGESQSKDHVQNKPGKANLFGQAEPSPDWHDVYDGEGHRGYVTLSFVMPTDKDGTVRGRERFRIPGMARMGNTYLWCAKEHGSDGNCVIGMASLSGHSAEGQRTNKGNF